MIDDSLSDTQQDRQEIMSVKQLHLKEGSQWLTVKHVDRGCFTIAISENLLIKEIGLDRSQAHLLMLYLQEHLNFGAQVLKSVEPKDDLLKGYYHCTCGMRHPKDFVCQGL